MNIDPAFITIVAMVLLFTTAFLSWQTFSLRKKLESQVGELALSQFNEFRRRELIRVESEQKNQAMTWAKNQLEKWKLENEAQIRKESKKKSEDIQIGQIYKRLTPFLEEFPWLPSDARFIGGPIDFIIFEGLSEDRQELKIHLVQVKTGQSPLSANQKLIREAVHKGKISWQEIRAFKKSAEPRPIVAVPPTVRDSHSLDFSNRDTQLKNRSQSENQRKEIEILHKSSAQVEEKEQLSEIPHDLYEAIYDYAYSWKKVHKPHNFKKWCQAISEQISEEVTERISLEDLRAIWNKAEVD